METIGADLRQMQRTPLAASHVQALRIAGKIATYPANTFLARPGDPMDRFIYIEEGEVEVVNPYTDERHLPSTLATSLPGIFAVGDVRAGSVKRVASSVGEGSVVISKVWEFVNRHA